MTDHADLIAKLKHSPTLEQIDRHRIIQLLGAAAAPVPMFLTCPACNARHIDKGVFATKPHHTHACQSCGLTWRPAIGPTVGVQFLPGFKDKELIDGELTFQTVEQLNAHIESSYSRAHVLEDNTFYYWESRCTPSEWRVYCQGCSATGHGSKADAIAAWNKRVASPEPPSPEGLGRSGVEAESIRRMAEYISDHSVFATTEAQAVARAYLALLALSPAPGE